MLGVMHDIKIFESVSVKEMAQEIVTLSFLEGKKCTILQPDSTTKGFPHMSDVMSITNTLPVQNSVRGLQLN